MTTNDFIKRLREIADQCGHHDKYAIAERAIEGLKTSEYRPVLEITLPCFIDKYVRTPAKKTSGDDVVDVTQVVVDSIPVGTPKNATDDYLIKKHPPLAPLIRKANQMASKSFPVFERTFTYADMTAADIRWIAEQYFALSANLSAIGDEYLSVADDLEARKVDRIGALPPKVRIQFVERLAGLHKGGKSKGA